MDEHAISNFQGPGRLASEEDIARDTLGYTNPNLHRRVDASAPSPESKEVKPRSYKFVRQGVYQMQLMETHYQDDDSDESEIP